MWLVSMEVEFAASRAIYMLDSCCVLCDVLQMNAELDALQQLALRACRNVQSHRLSAIDLVLISFLHRTYGQAR